MEFLHRDVREPDEVLVKIAESLGREIGQYLVRMQAEEAVKFMAMHDALTRLPNRVMFHERLTAAIAHAERHERSLAVLFVDLDKFKLINDTLGHEAGDFVLGEVAQRLTDNLRGGATRSRCQCRCALHAVWITQSPSGTMRPFSSARRMKRAGVRSPSSGCCQRTSASMPTMRPVHDSICGW
jgi:hypothetical protein